MPDNTVDDIIKNGTKDYCSPLYAAEMYAKGLCPLSDVEAAIRSAIEEKDKRIAELTDKVKELIDYSRRLYSYADMPWEDFSGTPTARAKKFIDSLTPSKDNKKGE